MLTLSKLTVEPAPQAAPMYVCAIETKYIEDWRLFPTIEAARTHLQAVALEAWNDAGGDTWNSVDEDDMDIVEWFQNRDSTYTATIQEVALEARP